MHYVKVRITFLGYGNSLKELAQIGISTKTIEVFSYIFQNKVSYVFLLIVLILNNEMA